MESLQHSPTDASSQNVPENSYGSAVHPAERRRLQSLVVQKYASRVNALARRQARGRDTAEANQVGILALIESLGHFDPTRGVSFWIFAFPRVREAVADWAHSEHFRTKRSGYGPSDPRFERAESRKHAESFDEGEHGVEADANPESLLIAAEERLRLEVFASGLSEDDRRALVPTVGRPKKDAGQRNNTLRARAKAFVEGKS